MAAELLESVSLFGFFLVIGAVVGLFSGLIGTGGGALLAPTLFFALTALGEDLSVALRMAVGSALMIIAVISALGVRSRLRLEAFEPALLWRTSPWIALGGALGALCAVFAPDAILLGAMGVASFAAALSVIFGESPPRKKRSTQLTSSVLGQSAALIGGGAVSGATGLGGGLVFAPFFRMQGLARPMANALATGGGLFASVAAALPMLFLGLFQTEQRPFSLGYVNLAAVAVIAPMLLAAAPFGAQLAQGFPRRPARLIFAFLLAIIALTIIRRAGGG